MVDDKQKKLSKNSLNLLHEGALKTCQPILIGLRF